MHNMPEFEDMYSFYKYLTRQFEVIEQIENMLPDSLGEACSIMSYIMDQFFIKHGVSVYEGWKIMDDIANEVHKELGDK